MTMETAASTVPTSALPAQRYRPAQVVLHWVVAALIIITALLARGGEGEGRRAGAAGIGGVPTLTFHMILGITVLVLLVVRLLMRWRTKSPDWATTGSGLLDQIGKWTHIGLYFFAFAVTITGLVLALQTNRLARAFSPGSGAGQFQPGQFSPPDRGFQSGQVPQGGGFRPEGGEGFRGGGGFFLGAFHGASWTILLLLIILHVGAALYHQFMRRDNLFGRMWFGKSSLS